MKLIIVRVSLLFMGAFLVVSCNTKENEAKQMEDSEMVSMPSDPLIKSDSTNLSYDSATVKTAVGVQDEEQNAIRNETADAEKLKKDKEGYK